MKLLFLGDIVGKSGREAIFNHVPKLRSELKIDFVIANCDNASGGFGINKKHFNQLLTNKIDVLTSGDHVWDQKEQYNEILSNDNILRPHNYPDNLPGKGYDLYNIKSHDKSYNYQILVVHLMGQLFMKHQVHDPFRTIEKILAQYQLGNNVQFIIIDIHAEATSEKMALGCFLDGKVSAVIGTHTHIPTADYRILPRGTAYQTDAGMCGDYDSVIGMNSQLAISNLYHKINKNKLLPAENEASIFATFIDLNDNTGLADEIRTINLGKKI